MKVTTAAVSIAISIIASITLSLYDIRHLAHDRYLADQDYRIIQLNIMTGHTK